MRPTIGWIWMGLVLGTGTHGRAAEVNLIRNPDFDQTYAAQRLSDTNRLYVRPDHTILPGYAKDAFLPYGWQIVPDKDGQGDCSQLVDTPRTQSFRLSWYRWLTEW